MPKTLNATELLELYECYLEFGSIDKVARECSKNWHTVERYVRLGNWEAKRQKWLELAQKELGIDSIELTKANLLLIGAAKDKLKDKIEASELDMKLSDLYPLIKAERLCLGQTTGKIDSPAATLNNIVIVSDNGTEQAQFEDEKAGQEEVEILSKYLEIKQNGNSKGRPANRLKAKK